MRYQRREFLGAGGALLVSTVTAGCAGDSQDGDDSGDEATPTPLAIENVTFTDGKPGGYREFEEASSRTFDESDTIWIYFEPAGFEREESGSGEVAVDLAMEMAIQDPDGEEIFTDRATLTKTVPEEAAVDAFFTGSFSPPIPTSSGEYTAVLEVQDNVAGDETETTATFTIDAGPDEDLAIEHLRFVRDQPREYREYEAVEDETYGLGDQIWLYYEPVGFGTEPADGTEVSFDLVTSLVVTAPSGTTVFDDDELLRETISETDVDEQFIFWNLRLPGDAETGEYTAEVGLEDQTTDRTTETTASFTVTEPETPETVENVPDILEEELDIEVTAFEDERRATLSYESPHAVNSEDGSYEIGYIVAFFAELVGEGWDVDSLTATVTDGDGDRFRYRADAETAQAYIDDEIELETYVDEVLATLEPV